MTGPKVQEATEINLPLGENLAVPERMIVAPAAGVFRLRKDPALIRVGTFVSRGDIVGTLQSLGTSTAIKSPFDGLLVEILAIEGERMRPGQPVAWLRAKGQVR